MHMLVACWSAKGGSGTTVVAVALATLLARPSGSSLLVDLAGDVPAVLGLPEPSGAGVHDWLAAGDAVPTDALSRLEVAGPAGVRVVPRGASSDEGAADGRGDVLAALLASDPRPVVVDCGSQPCGAARTIAASASVSLLVLRPCYLALRRAAAFPLRPSGVVLVQDDGRTLTPADIEAVLDVPVRAVVAVDPAIAVAVDTGSLADRLPRRLQRSLRRAA
jgi:MinD-like ATPase involved in chromosome partitioning or flagellar assembly